MALSTDNETRIVLFQSIGLNEQKARETLKNQDVSRLLETTINEVEENLVFFFSLLHLFAYFYLGKKNFIKRKSNIKIYW